MSLVVATILVAGVLVLPYNYAIAHKGEIGMGASIKSIETEIQKKIKQETASHAGVQKKIAQSDVPDTLLALLTALRASSGSSGPP